MNAIEVAKKVQEVFELEKHQIDVQFTIISRI